MVMDGKDGKSYLADGHFAQLEGIKEESMHPIAKELLQKWGDLFGHVWGRVQGNYFKFYTIFYVFY